MKRHESLIALSRDHHEGLILSQLIKYGAPVYRNMPQTTEGKILYAKEFYRHHLLQHFQKEERLFEKVKSINRELADLTTELEEEHRELHHLFALLDGPGAKEEKLNNAGVKLEAHIRKEERVFFPLIEKHGSIELLKELSSLSQ